MARLKLILDTNIIVDFLHQREPFFEDARKLLICGRAGEFDLQITSSQMTDLVYILSDGGKKQRLPSALRSLRGLRSFIGVLPIGSSEVDMMLASQWGDPEDYLIYNAALHSGADAIITSNGSDFESALIPTFDCAQFFDWIHAEFNIDYAEIDL